MSDLFEVVYRWFAFLLGIYILGISSNLMSGLLLAAYRYVTGRRVRIGRQIVIFIVEMMVVLLAFDFVEGKAVWQYRCTPCILFSWRSILLVISLSGMRLQLGVREALGGKPLSSSGVLVSYCLRLLSLLLRFQVGPINHFN